MLRPLHRNFEELDTFNFGLAQQSGVHPGRAWQTTHMKNFTNSSLKISMAGRRGDKYEVFFVIYLVKLTYSHWSLCWSSITERFMVMICFRWSPVFNFFFRFLGNCKEVGQPMILYLDHLFFLFLFAFYHRWSV